MLDTSNNEALRAGLTMVKAMGGTVEFSVVIGVGIGYAGLDPALVDDAKARDIVATSWQRHATKLYNRAKKRGDEAPLMISAAATNADAVYLREWGCPVGGEVAVEMRGICHPEFHGASVEAILRWWEAVKVISEEVRHECGQFDAWLKLSPVFKFHHLKQKENDN